MTLFQDYDNGGFSDDMFAPKGAPRPHYESVHGRLRSLSAAEFRSRCDRADVTLMNEGITFTVYGDDRGVEKPFPVDLLPRIVPAAEWAHVERGLTQRVRALNLFLHDVYNDQKILKDGIVPRELVVNAP